MVLDAKEKGPRAKDMTSINVGHLKPLKTAGGASVSSNPHPENHRVTLQHQAEHLRITNSSAGKSIFRASIHSP